MEVSKKWLAIAILLVVLGTASLTIGLMDYYGRHVLNLNGSVNGSVGISFTSGSIHATITIYKGNQKILEQYHAGAVTKLGMNATLAKLTGNVAAYNMTEYNLNLTYVSIGNSFMGTLDSDSKVLPGEWNRTIATQHDCTYNSFNLTAQFKPAIGPYAADCIGINFEGGTGNNALWGYDTFTRVTGIDNTFTINIEFKVTIS